MSAFRPARPWGRAVAVLVVVALVAAAGVIFWSRSGSSESSADSSGAAGVKSLNTALAAGETGRLSAIEFTSADGTAAASITTTFTVTNTDSGDVISVPVDGYGKQTSTRVSVAPGTSSARDSGGSGAPSAPA